MPPSYRLAALLLLAIAASETLAQSVSGSSSATCDADVTLDVLASSDVCGTYCATYEPCAVLDSAGLTCESNGSLPGDTSDCVVSDTCAVTCVQYSSLTFEAYVPFGAFQSEEELAARAVDNYSYQSSVDSLYGSVEGYFYLNDDLLDTIGTLELNPYTSSVLIAGGQSAGALLQSKVVNVSLSGTFIANQSQVTTVSLTSLNLKDQVDNLPSLLPSSVTELTLANNLIYEFPWSLLDVMPALETLSMQMNYISIVKPTTTTSYTSITYIYLLNNEITEFDGSFPNIGTLLLSGNNLTKIPEAIKDMPLLTNLDVGSNNITTVDSSVSSDSITTLYINNNGLTKFEGSFPNLETLIIRYNSLTAIPEAIYECSKLSYLAISSNPLTLNLTRAQLEFLRKIDSIDITASDVANATWDCHMDQLNGIAVCITDADEAEATSSDSGGGDSNTGAIIGGVVGGVVALALLIAAIAFFVYRKRNSGDADGKDYQSAATPAAGAASTVTDSNDVTTTGMSAMSSSRSLASDPKLLPLQLNPRDLQDIRMIGEGSTSVYWLVRYRRDTLLASKRLRTEEARRDSVAAFVREIKLVATLDHPSIVKFAGISWRAGEKEEPAQVAASLQALFEYVDNGTLREYLSNPGVPRTWHTEKLDVAIDIADALVYLHSLSPPVLHRDVRSSNVLLTNDMRGKVGSFGCAKSGAVGDAVSDLASFHGASFGGSGRGETVDDSGVSAARWVAPEVLASASDHGEAADMYSFGVLLLELDTHGLPFDDAFTRGTGSDAHSRVVDERAVLQRIVSGELQPAFGLRCPPALVTLGLACLDRNPWNRPRAPDVAYKLRQVLKALGTGA